MKIKSKAYGPFAKGTCRIIYMSESGKRVVVEFSTREQIGKDTRKMFDKYLIWQMAGGRETARRKAELKNK